MPCLALLLWLLRLRPIPFAQWLQLYRISG
ncbi:hypothetical protein [Caudoviricetes sp.]|nr:hypothetical protein [Caudoviricetes sp.]